MDGEYLGGRIKEEHSEDESNIKDDRSDEKKPQKFNRWKYFLAGLIAIMLLLFIFLVFGMLSKEGNPQEEIRPETVSVVSITPAAQNTFEPFNGSAESSVFPKGGPDFTTKCNLLFKVGDIVKPKEALLNGYPEMRGWGNGKVKEVYTTDISVEFKYKSGSKTITRTEDGQYCQNYIKAK